MNGCYRVRPDSLRSLVADGHRCRGSLSGSHFLIIHDRRLTTPSQRRITNSIADRNQKKTHACIIRAHTQQQKQQHGRALHRAECLGGALLILQMAALSSPEAGHAAEFLAGEPSNALSLPTWAIHTSSVIEWGIAMSLMWKYGEVSGNERWKGMTWGMLPCLGSAMCACTWHFFYNAPELEFLVALQAFLTIVGNTTCWIAAYRIYQSSVQQE